MTDNATPDPATTQGPATLFAAPAPPAADAEPAPDDSTRHDPPAPGGGTPFGLVFQAPDLSAVPTPASRRRAESAQPDDDEGTGQDQESRAPRRPGRNDRRAAADPDRPEEGRGASGGADAAEDEDQDDDGEGRGRRRRRGGKGRRSRGSAGDAVGPPAQEPDDGKAGDTSSSEDSTDDTEGRGRSSARGRGRRGSGGGEEEPGRGDGPAESSSGGEETGDPEESGSKRRRRRRRGEVADRERPARDEVSGVKGSTRLEAKRQRRREGREAGRRRTVISEAEFLARRESVERKMVVRGQEDRTQIGVLEDGVLVEHYVSKETQSTMVGNVYLGRVQNVLPSMEAAFVDLGKGRNAVLYAGEVNWDAAGLEVNQAKRIENALSSGESVLVQVTKDPIGHKGARLTSQVSLPGRYLVYVPGNSMTGISRKLPDTERTRLKKILREVVPEDAGVIVRTAAEGASETELRADVERLTTMWERIQAKAGKASAPALLHGEPDMTVRVIRDVFNEDFTQLVVSGDRAWKEVSDYISGVAPDLADRVQRWTGVDDVFTSHRVTESLAKAMDRKVWLPSGGSLVIDRTEAMTVVDVNTGKFVGSGGNLEETVTKNNIEAAEEIVRQLRLRDIGGIIVIDFIDMVLESNRDLVVRRLLECLGRDRTKHQVAEVTSLGLVQMTRKRVGSGLIEVFSEPCVHCHGRGLVVHSEPVERTATELTQQQGSRSRGGRKSRGGGEPSSSAPPHVLPPPAPGGPSPAQIAAAAHAAALQAGSTDETADATARAVEQVAEKPDRVPVEQVADPPAEIPAPRPSTAAAPVDVQPPGAGTADPVPPPRAKRRRGRAVAPAGPPGTTPVEGVSGS